MPIQSRWTCDIPQVSVPTYLFGSPTAKLSEKPIIMDAREPEAAFLTQTTYRLWCQRFAAGLLRAGLQPGDRVLLYSGNSIYFPVVIVGTIMAGGVFSGANPQFTPRELTYQLQNTGAKFLIASTSSIETAVEAAKTAGLGLDCVFAFDDGLATAAGEGKAVGAVRHWTELVASEEEGRRYCWPEMSPEQLRNTTATLNYSSGTTGVPKGVEVTHANYVSNAVQVEFQGRLDPEFDAKTARANLLCFLPMYHAYGLTFYTFGAAKRDVPVYMMTKFDFIAMLTYIQKYRITTLTLVPPVVVAMAKSPITKQYDLSSVETVGCGAAPLGREVCVELEALWPNGQVNVKQGWGMTEITCSAMGWDPQERSDSFSVGELNANCEAMIVDPEYDFKSAAGNQQQQQSKVPEVARGERGELWVRGPNVMKGYWQREDATAETLVTDSKGQVWLMTGDIVYVDERNRFYVVDRKKELIKTKGNQVAPAELEALLLDHAAVADAAVVGVAVEHDERPRAYLVLAEGYVDDKNISEKEIQKFVADRVVSYKRLTGGVQFIDAIPKNPSGKILRKLLRERAQGELKGEKARL